MLGGSETPLSMFATIPFRITFPRLQPLRGQFLGADPQRLSKRRLEIRSTRKDSNSMSIGTEKTRVDSNRFFSLNSTLGESLMDGLTRPPKFAHADTIASTMWGSSWPPAKDWSRWESSLEEVNVFENSKQDQKAHGSLLVDKELLVIHLMWFTHVIL